MDKYEPFDLKITKLTGIKWQRENVATLLRQLISEQGRPRYSVENRIISAFDRSLNSSLEFLQLNRNILLEALLNIAYNPYVFTYLLSEYHYWFGITLITNYHHIPEYYEHCIGSGMREPEKAKFENELIREVALKSDGRIKYNANPKERGHDGDLLIDRGKIKDADAQIEPAPLFETRKLSVCDYGNGSVAWANCLPCPLYKDGHCLSRGAAVHKAIYQPLPDENRLSPYLNFYGPPSSSKIEKETKMTEIPSTPIERWIAHHRKRGVTLRGLDGRVIDWLWCLSTWDKLGRPVAYAAPGDPFYDLSLYMYPERLSPRKLQGIVTWLEEHSGERQQ